MTSIIYGLYKCRLCGELYEGPRGPADNAGDAGWCVWATMNQAVLRPDNWTEPMALNAKPHGLTASHPCDSNSMGVADFVGIRHKLDGDA